MNNRIHLKDKSKLYKNKKIILLFILFLTTLVIFKIIIFNIANYFLRASKAEVIQITNAYINYAVTNDDLKDLEISNMYNITKNSNNEIEMVDYNSVAVNKFLSNITKNIQKRLFELEEGNMEIIGKSINKNNVAFYIPFGSITNNPILNNIGPNIPVKIKTIGTIVSNIKVNIKEYGINSSLIEMQLNIEINQQIILPMLSDTVKITNSIPVSYKIINGKIPNYYSGAGLNKNSSIYSIPIE